MSEKIEIRRIMLDGGTQPRAQLSFVTIADYTEAFKEGVELPPVDVFYDGQRYWLADGFHRTRAAIDAGKRSITAKVHQGTQRDAILFSVSANAEHGLRRTNEDKRRAVIRLLNDEEWSQWSNREIARRCKVGKTLVNKIRNETKSAKSDRAAISPNKKSKSNTVKYQKNGRVTFVEKPEPSPLPPLPPIPESESQFTAPLPLPQTETERIAAQKEAIKIEKVDPVTKARQDWIAEGVEQQSVNQCVVINPYLASPDRIAEVIDFLKTCYYKQTGEPYQ